MTDGKAGEGKTTPLWARRRAGILLHPTSLPGGDLGPEAYRFVEFLASAGMGVWQMLPLVPTHEDLSPYQGLSAYAGNPLLISPAPLVERGWLAESAPAGRPDHRRRQLRQAYEGFCAKGSEEERQALAAFVDTHGEEWLRDYALFCSLRRRYPGHRWPKWPKELRDRHPAALARAEQELKEELDYVYFEQYLFFSQWQRLRDYARRHGVLLFGDLPLFVAHDSADVWARRELFMLDEAGHPEAVAGVPPDYFSETGQRWGNPHYRWQRMADDDYAWWQARLRGQLELFDWIRIDHFRGLEAYWEIPAAEKTALNGRWVLGPGEDFFASLARAFGGLPPLVAEDLGIITPPVEALRRRFALPGMKILQFAFDSDDKNPYLPHNHSPDSVVYTGTHDNDTLMGWWAELSEATRQRALEYLGQPGEELPWPLIRAALASVAGVAIIPMQDLLALAGDQRMNTPGTTHGNWRWRFDWEQVPAGLAGRLRAMVALYGRI